MEYLDLYDKNKQKTGQTILRAKDMLILKDLYILIVIIFIENSEGKFLFQKVSKEKGDIFATTGGHVKSGDDSIDAITTEVKEELGTQIEQDEIKLIDTIIYDTRILDVYYIKKDLDINDLTLQKAEVDSVYWLSIDEIKELIKQNKVRKSNIDSFIKLINK